MPRYVTRICPACYGTTSSMRFGPEKIVLMAIGLSWGLFEFLFPRPKILIEMQDWNDMFLLAMAAGPLLCFLAGVVAPRHRACDSCGSTVLVPAGSPRGTALVLEMRQLENERQQAVLRAAGLGRAPAAGETAEAEQ